MGSSASETALPTQKCPQCGRGYLNEFAFCLQCGQLLVPSAATPHPAPEALPVSTAVPGGPPASATPEPLAETRPEPSHAPVLITDVFYPPQADALRRGVQVGEYIVGDKIGDGGMGVIYSAVHPVIGKKVALKVLRPELAANAEVVQRFIQEAKAVNQIGHRNIVDIFSFGRLSDGRHYFAMEHLAGESLASRIAADKPVPWEDALQMWLQIASAVGAAHDNEIIHRDLKPDNVYVTPTPDGPFVKVLDFGIAKLLGDAPGVAKTSAGSPIGTPMYMAPEQARGETLDARTDIYAYGAIVYETIAGRPPFNHHTFVALLAAQMNELPPPLSGFVDIHVELHGFIKRLLAKKREDRPKDMSEVRAELLRLRDLSIRQGIPLYAPKGTVAALASHSSPAPPPSLAGPRRTAPMRAPPRITEALPPSERVDPNATRSPDAEEAAAASVEQLPTPPSAAPKRRAVPAAVAAAMLAVIGVGIAISNRTPETKPTSAVIIPRDVAPPATPHVESPSPANAAPATAPALGRLAISTNALTTRVFLDKSATERSASPAAAGGMNLKVPVPAGVDWVLRIEADGFKTVTMPLRIAPGEESSLPVVLTAVEAPRSPRPHSDTWPKPRIPGHEPSAPPQTGKPAPAAPGNENFINPF